MDFEIEETNAGYTADTKDEYISLKFHKNHYISTVYSPIEQNED